MFCRGRDGGPLFCPLLVGLRFAAFVITIDGGWLAAISYYKKCFGGLKKKVEEELDPKGPFGRGVS